MEARWAYSSPSGDLIQFAINTFGERSTPAYPVEFDIHIDSNNDGNPEYILINAVAGSVAGRFPRGDGDLTGGGIQPLMFSE